MGQHYSSKGKWWYHGQRRAPMTFLNEQIKAPTIVIVDAEWVKLWSFPRRKALELADEKWLDLVQMRYDQPTMTSTVKMIDYGKYQYQKQKDDREKKKTQKSKWLKELKMWYTIGDNDLSLKVKKAEELLKEWYGVKVVIRLRGREKIYAEAAKKKLMSVVEQLQDFWRSQYGTAKKEAQWYSIILFTKKK